MLNNQNLLSRCIFAVIFTYIGSSIAYAAISWPATPDSETTGWAVWNLMTVLFQDSGNIWIGTGSPIGKLHVAGGRIRMDNDQYLNFGVTNTAWIKWKDNASSDGYLELGVWWAERVTINKFGYVGIGTTNPSVKLQIEDASMWIVDVVTTWWANSRLSSDSTKWYAWTVTNHPFNIFTNNAIRMTIDTTGNVGIGNASPEGLLHVHKATAGSITADAMANELIVENSIDGWISILVPDANGSRLYFGSPSDNRGANLIWNHDTGLMVVGTHKSWWELQFNTDAGGVQAMRINNSGNVGIGTTSPGSKLDVVWEINSTSFKVSSTAPQMQWHQTNGTTDNKFFDFYWTWEWFKWRVINDAHSVATNWLEVERTGTTVDYVSFPNGNVGIGTTNPANKLSVSGWRSSFNPTTEVYAVWVTRSEANSKTYWLGVSEGGESWSLQISNSLGSPLMTIENSWAVKALGIMPIGSIIAWHSSIAGASTEAEINALWWVLCDGTDTSEISDASISTTPNLNWEWRFLRWSSTSWTQQNDQVQEHKHGNPMAIQYVASALDFSAKSRLVLWSSVGANVTAHAIAYSQPIDQTAYSVRVWSETRSKNMSVVWIMRVK